MKRKGLNFLMLRKYGVALFAALVLAGNATAKTAGDKSVAAQPDELAIPATSGAPVLVERDTVYIKADDLRKQQFIVGGEYFKSTNRFVARHFADTTATATGRDMKYMRLVNDKFAAADYHEVRHAMNNYWIGRVKNPHPIIFVANEFWARVAQGLALHLNLPALPAGYTDMNVDYRTADHGWASIITEPKYNYGWSAFSQLPIVTDEMRAAVDSALNFAVTSMTATFDHYNSSGFNSGSQNVYKISANQNKHRLLEGDAVLDSMRLFRINGRQYDIRSVASADMRTRADNFFAEFVPKHIKISGRGQDKERFARANGSAYDIMKIASENAYTRVNQFAPNKIKKLKSRGR